MAPTPSIKILHSMPYQGGSKEWACRYHFNGGTPADSAHWETLRGNVVAAEKLALSPAVTIVGADGYAAGSDVPVFSWSGSVAGTLSETNAFPAPGAVAALVRYATAARTTKNHPVYLFNYYHYVSLQTTGAVDLLHPTQKTALETYATAWIAGFSDGVNTYNRAGPNGASATSRFVNQYLTHRDFPD
jgi:hypothetical protein